MKSLPICVFLFTLVSLTGNAQDLILKQGDTVVNNDSIYLTGTKTTELIEISLSVTNNRDVAVRLKLKKTDIQLVEGTESSFCWGECYTPSVFVSPMLITIQPKACDTKSFVGDYRSFGLEGTSIVKYTFFDPADTLYQQSVTVFYQIGGSGINDILTSGKLIRVGPNPADGSIRISLPAQMNGTHLLSLITVTGQEVARQNLPSCSNEITWPVASFPSGVYYLRISDEKGGITTRKICINH
jgi:hypothetical protein